MAHQRKKQLRTFGRDYKFTDKEYDTSGGLYNYNVPNYLNVSILDAFIYDGR